MQLIQVNPEHYIIVDDSEIKEGDCKYNPEIGIWQHNRKSHGMNFIHPSTKKIIHSTPIEGLSAMFIAGVKELSLSEVEEAIYGDSVEKMADKYANEIQISGQFEYYEAGQNTGRREGYEMGFNTHKELVKDKLFTVEQAFEIFKRGHAHGLSETPDNEMEARFKLSIESLLPKTEWDVKFVDGKLQLV